MPSKHAHSSVRLHQLSLQDTDVEFRLILSKAAKKMRVRVGPNGIEVVHPQGKDIEEILNFVQTNAAWILEQLHRVEKFRGIRRPKTRTAGRILFRGEPIHVSIKEDDARSGANHVIHDSDKITVIRSSTSATQPAKSLENWLRKQARSAVEEHLEAVTIKLKRQPGKVLIMGQRTKWGNCSRLQNLSFNWRLIMAPQPVLRYLVTHEAVHLAVPDHSHKFWLTVRSLCPETERAKQWLCANAHELLVDLNEVCGRAS
jgi:predicted metal-dependent hydrolase